MKSEQIKRRFMDELQHLLVKWGAELTAEDHWEGYPECGEDVRMTVTVPAIYDADHNCLREFTEIDLGSYAAAARGGEAVSDLKGVDVKIKTSELIGPALDWAVAVCEEKPIRHDPMGFGRTANGGYWVWPGVPVMRIGKEYSPSTDWAQGGPIIEREGIWVNARCENVWGAYKKIKWDTRWRGTLVLTGTTYLIAAMRCYVASKLGDEVDVPEELLK